MEEPKLAIEKIKIDPKRIKSLLIYLEGLKQGKENVLYPESDIDIKHLYNTVQYLQGNDMFEPLTNND